MNLGLNVKLNLFEVCTVRSSLADPHQLCTTHLTKLCGAPEMNDINDFEFLFLLLRLDLHLPERLPGENMRSHKTRAANTATTLHLLQFCYIDPQ